MNIRSWASLAGIVALAVSAIIMFSMENYEAGFLALIALGVNYD